MVRAWDPNGDIAEALVYEFLAGPWEHAPMVAAGRRAIGRSPRWIGALVGELRAHFRAGPLDRPGELAHRIRQSDSFHLGLERATGQGHPVRVVRLRAEPTRMVRRPWPVPVVDDVAALARQLGLISDHLTWLSDPAGMQRRTPDGPHHPYHYSWLTRPGAAPRLLESPTPVLRATMRRVLRDILVWVPAHDAAHGFVPGRSALTHAANPSARRPSSARTSATSSPRCRRCASAASSPPWAIRSRSPAA